MEDITALHDLPEIVRLVDCKSCDDESSLMERMIFLHVPTSAIVEIIPGKLHNIDSWQIYYEFTDVILDDTELDYTALLLNYNNPVLADKSFVINKILKPIAWNYSCAFTN